MKPLTFLREFAIIFAVTFLVSAIVTYLYSLVAQGAGLVDWETSFRFGIILGIIFPLRKVLEKSKG